MSQNDNHDTMGIDAIDKHQEPDMRTSTDQYDTTDDDDIINHKIKKNHKKNNRILFIMIGVIISVISGFAAYKMVHMGNKVITDPYIASDSVVQSNLAPLIDPVLNQQLKPDNAINASVTPQIKSEADTILNHDNKVLSSVDQVLLQKYDNVKSSSADTHSTDSESDSDKLILNSKILDAHKKQINALTVLSSQHDKALRLIQAENAVLKKRVTSLEEKMDSAAKSLRTARSVLRKMTKKSPNQSRLSPKKHIHTSIKTVKKDTRIIYILDGIVDGRAWVHRDGNDPSVLIEGDSLKGYGKIKSISAMNGIDTSKGVVRVIIAK